MKKLVAFFIATFSALAMSAPQSYIEGLKSFLNEKEFPINGYFYAYDFEHDGKINYNDWLYIAKPSNTPYRLLGSTPTPRNKFGWKKLATAPSDVNYQHPNGYFIFINYPQDSMLYGTNAFSWVYVTEGSYKVFKLMGATPQNTFEYLDEDGDGYADPLSGITVNRAGENLVFHYASQNEGSGSGTPAAGSGSCQDSDSQSFGTMSYSIQTKSTYQGSFEYDCKLDSDQNWKLHVPQITVNNVILKINIDLQNDKESIKGIATYEYAQAKERFQGTYNGRHYDCYTIYNAHPVPKTLYANNPAEMDGYFEPDWADPCSVGIVSTTCPGFMTACEGGIDNEDYTQYTHMKMKEIRDYTIYDNQGKIHKVHTDQTLNFHR